MVIASGLLAGDELSFTASNGIQGSYDASTGQLTLSGTASLTAYQAALDSVTYSSTATDPSNAGTDTSRIVDWSVNDGTRASQAVGSTIGIVVPGPSKLTFAQYIADPAAADAAPDGFDITDSAAKVSTIFDALNADPHLDTMTLTDTGTPALFLTSVQALNDTTALGKISNASYAIAIEDIAANVASNLDALNADPAVTSITLTDPLDPLTVSVAQITGDAGALGKLTNGYSLAVTSSAAVVSGALDALQANAHAASITLTDPSDPLTVSVGQIAADVGALGLLTSGYSLAVTGSAAVVSGALDALQANDHVSSLTLADPLDPLTVSVGQITSDAEVLGKLTNGYGLAVTDNAAAVSGPLNALQANAHVVSIALTDGGTPTLNLTIEQALNDGTALGKITSLHALAISDSAANKRYDFRHLKCFLRTDQRT